MSAASPGITTGYFGKPYTQHVSKSIVVWLCGNSMSLDSQISEKLVITQNYLSLEFNKFIKSPQMIQI